MNSYSCNVTDAKACCRNGLKKCHTTVLAILGVLLALATGIIVGASIASSVLEAMPAFIATATLLAVMLTVFLILRICTESRSCG